MSEFDWEIRPYTATDCDEVRRLLVSAFPSEAEAGLVERLRRDGAAEIEFVAESEGHIIGHVLLSRMEEPAGTLALAPVAVNAAFRRHGVASSLIESGLALATAEDWSGVFVLGDLAYYERFGFERKAGEGFSSPYAGEHFAYAVLEEETAPKKGTARHPAAFGAL